MYFYTFLSFLSLPLRTCYCRGHTVEESTHRVSERPILSITLEPALLDCGAVGDSVMHILMDSVDTFPCRPCTLRGVADSWQTKYGERSM